MFRAEPIDVIIKLYSIIEGSVSRYYSNAIGENVHAIQLFRILDY